jgi:hypothetical protein
MLNALANVGFLGAKRTVTNRAYQSRFMSTRRSQFRRHGAGECAERRLPIPGLSAYRLIPHIPERPRIFYTPFFNVLGVDLANRSSWLAICCLRSGP